VASATRGDAALAWAGVGAIALLDWYSSSRECSSYRRTAGAHTWGRPRGEPFNHPMLTAVPYLATIQSLFKPLQGNRSDTDTRNSQLLERLGV